MSDGRPVPPPELDIYDSYAIDPKYALAFTAAWTSVMALSILLYLPRLLSSLRNGRLLQAWIGINETLSGDADYHNLIVKKRQLEEVNHSGIRGLIRTTNSAAAAFTYFTPRWVRLDIGQIFVVLAYFAVLIVCITHQAQLAENANRAGFLAVAQLPVIFLFATKNSVLSLLLGKGYEKLNYIHRWSGRGIFIAATIHGSLWIKDHLKLGPQLLAQEKELLGMAAYTVLGLILLLSLNPVRRKAYQLFFVSHVVGYVTFFILVCYHTPYAQPWIFPPLAFYAFDILIRMFRYRIKDAMLFVPEPGMTLITIADCDNGWVAGQHVRLRVFFSGRIFESHPMTIVNAPRSISVQPFHGTILLGARTNGEWSRALNDLGIQSQETSPLEKMKGPSATPEFDSPHATIQPTPLSVMIDGPYGGLTIDLGGYENVFLVAGGAGVTFTLAVLDDIVGRVVRLGRRGGEKTRRIEFAWCIKSFGCILWFTQNLMDIAKAAEDSSIDLRMSFFVTCFCDPSAAPAIPNSRIIVEKPTIKSLLLPFLPPTDIESNVAEQPPSGGLAICASGPDSLITEAHNEVAALGIACIHRMGGVGIHTEAFVF